MEHDFKKLSEMIYALSKAPPDELSSELSKLCQSPNVSTADEAREFLRNLRDDAKHTKGASATVMMLFDMFVSDPRETIVDKNERYARRKNDLRWMNINE